MSHSITQKNIETVTQAHNEVAPCPQSGLNNVTRSSVEYDRVGLID